MPEECSHKSGCEQPAVTMFAVDFEVMGYACPDHRAEMVELFGEDVAAIDKMKTLFQD